MQTLPSPDGGGIRNYKCTLYNSWQLHGKGFKTHCTLEIPAEITFIHPLEAKENWVATGPQYELGNKITTLAIGNVIGIVHGFVIQPDKSLLVLVWFNKMDRYQQLRPDQIRSDKATLPMAPQGATTGQMCLSGCTLLANPSGGIQMWEVRPGTLLINKKGKQVRVTNVYFSVESSVMVQISEHCHASITHPILDTKRTGRGQQAWEPPGRTIVAAGEWYTRRPNDTHCNSTMYGPTYKPFGPRVGRYLHASSPQNLRRSGDMWGFSTESNEPVRSFDDPHCLICPIGHVGWAQVDIDTAILNCWGRSIHLPDPRPDLVEFQEQTKAIHTFLSKSEAFKALETRH